MQISSQEIEECTSKAWRHSGTLNTTSSVPRLGKLKCLKKVFEYQPVREKRLLTTMNFQSM